MSDFFDDMSDSSFADLAQLLLSDELRSELDRRLESFEKEPDDGVSFEKLKNRLTRSKCGRS